MLKNEFDKWWNCLSGWQVTQDERLIKSVVCLYDALMIKLNKAMLLKNFFYLISLWLIVKRIFYN